MAIRVGLRWTAGCLMGLLLILLVVLLQRNCGNPGGSSGGNVQHPSPSGTKQKKRAVRNVWSDSKGSEATVAPGTDYFSFRQSLINDGWNPVMRPEINHWENEFHENVWCDEDACDSDFESAPTLGMVRQIAYVKCKSDVNKELCAGKEIFWLIVVQDRLVTRAEADAEYQAAKTFFSNTELRPDPELDSAYQAALKLFPVPAFLQTSQRFWMQEHSLCVAGQSPLNNCDDALSARIKLLKTLAYSKVYTAYGKDFTVDEVTMILLSIGSHGVLWIFGDYMPDMNIPQPPPNGFLIDELFEIHQIGSQTFIKPNDEIYISDKEIVFPIPYLVTLRQGQLKGPYFRIQ